MAQNTQERRYAMFWTVLMLTGLAVVFTQLGAMSVWIAVLKLGLLASLLIIAVAAGIIAWRKAFPSDQ
jgi:hypothetical protein